MNMQKGARWALNSLDITGHVKWPLLEAVVYRDVLEARDGEKIELVST